jgi:galactoside O-acetyltransferase
MDDFSGLSSRVSVYSSTDDYTGLGLTNPMISEEYRHVTNGDVIIKKHAVIGSDCLILPNVTIQMGVSIYAKSLVKSDCDELYIYAGIPCKKIKKRYINFLELEKKIINNEN